MDSTIPEPFPLQPEHVVAALHRMFRSGLVPRPMALLGLIGGPLLCLAGIAVLFGVVPQGGPQQSLAAMPEFFWELALGIYLTVKGFRPAAAISQPARTATNELIPEI